MSSSHDPYAQPGDSAAGAEALSDAEGASESVAISDSGVNNGHHGPTGAKVFYRVEVRNITFGEFKAAGNPFEAAIGGFLHKVLRLPSPSSTDDPPIESLDAFVVPLEQVPAHILKKFQPAAAQLATLGFTDPIYHVIEVINQKTRHYIATYSHPHLPVIAKIHNRIWEMTNPPKDRYFFEFMSEFADRSIVWSLSSKPDLLTPANFVVQNSYKQSVQGLWDKHAAILETKLLAHGGTPVRNALETREFVNRVHTQLRDFHIERGVFKPLSSKQEAVVSEAIAATEAARSSGSVYPEIMAEITKLQKAKVGWFSTIILLLISLGLFIGFGLTGQSSLPWIAKIVPILFFHEAGHYIAMKMCGYTNMRMFFIPGFGAMVTGRNYNVPGWKKAFVSLMGPLPGIGIGIVLGLIGLNWHKPELTLIGAIAVGLNGFNLLPVLPLDGGRVLQTTLFSRHWVLDVIFQVLTALTIVITLTVIGSRIGIYIGISMAMGVLNAVKVGQAAADLKREGFVPVSHDNQTISVEAADRIISKLKSREKKPVHAMVSAQQTLSVFESLNTRPPSWLATIGLLSLHGISFLAAVVFTILFVASLRGTGAGGFVGAALNQAGHSVSVIETQGTPRVPDAATGAPAARLSDIMPVPETEAVIATLSSEKKAARAFDDVTARLKPGESVERIGETLIITIPRNTTATTWLDEFTPQDPQVFIAGQKMDAHFKFSFLASSAAEAAAIADAINGCGSIGHAERFIPPWSLPPARMLSPEQAKARTTLKALTNSHIYKDPSLKAINDKISATARRGQDTKALQKEHADRWKELEKIHADSIMNDTSGKYDSQLVRDRQAILDKEGEDKGFEAVRTQLAPRLGMALPPPPPLPPGTKKRVYEGEEYLPDPKYPPGVLEAANPLGIHSGYATNDDLFVTIEYMDFIDLTRGPAAFIKWLEVEKHCNSIRYDVTGSQRYDEEEEPAEPAPGSGTAPAEKK